MKLTNVLAGGALVVAAALAGSTGAKAECYSGEGCGITHVGWYATQFYEVCQSVFTQPGCHKQLLNPSGPPVRMVYDLAVADEAACSAVILKQVAATGIDEGSCLDVTVLR